MITGIKFPPATLTRLQAEAEKSGKDIDTLVTEAVEAKMALAHLSLQDVLRPINDAIAESGMTPEEAEAFFEQELSAMRGAQTMTITINLPPATIEQLKAEAEATGKDVETVVREAVETKLARRKQTFAEVLKPIHDEVEASGMSEEEVEALVDKELKAVRAARRSSQGKP